MQGGYPGRLKGVGVKDRQSLGKPETPQSKGQTVARVD